MALIGPDFRRALKGWQYNMPPVQRFWAVIGLTFVIVLIYFVLQSVSALLAYVLVYGGSLFSASASVASQASAELMKSSLIGIGPAAIAGSALTVWFSRLFRTRTGPALPLAWPHLGAFGWVLLIVGFALTMYIIFILVFVVLQIDPQAYSPAGGAEKAGKNAGLVERSMAELSKDPAMYLLAVPGVMIFVPIAEELMFRGALFNAILYSRAGKWGAVVITAAAWAAIHLFSAPLLFAGVIFAMGLILGLLLLRFGSLWVTIICHMVWNGINTLMIFGAAQQMQ